MATKDDKPQDLQAFVHERATQLGEGFVNEGADPPSISEKDLKRLKKELKQLQFLARLIEIQQLSRPSTRRRRWVVVMAFLVTLVGASLLFFVRVSTTDILLEVDLTDVGFRLGSDHRLFARPIVLSELSVSGIREVKLPRGQDRRRNHQLNSVQIQQADTTTGATITFDLELPDSSVVQLSQQAHQHQLILSDSREELSALVKGFVKVVPGVVDTFRLLRAREIIFYTRKGSAQLAMSLPTGPPHRVFASPFPIRRLSLNRLADTLSSVIKGTVYFEELSGKTHTLHSGEKLFLQIKKGTIRSINLAPYHFTLQFSGTVEKIKSGEHDLRPSWLEYLSARQGLYLLWGTVIYFFSLLYGVFRWWGVSQ